MRFGIVEPVEYASTGNAGWHMINAGVRWLFRQALPGVEFVSLPMLRPWDDDEQNLAKTCDVLVLAGNPRYDLGAHEWLYAGVMDQMLATGRSLIDAWSGSAVQIGNSLEHDAQRLLAHPRNQGLLERLGRFDFAIARDALAQRVNELAGIRSVELPCSSWWARRELGIDRQGGKAWIFIAHRVAETREAIQSHARAGWRVVATDRYDAACCREMGVEPDLIFRPAELLSAFATADSVVSCRLHSAIPAASLGCKTAIIAIDTRSQAGDAFGIPWAGPNETPMPCAATDPVDPTETLRELLSAYH